MPLNEISCEPRAQNDQLARNGIAAAPSFTLCQENLLLLFLLAAIQSEELSACLLTLVNNLIPSTGFQLKLLEYFIHLHPCKLHGYDIAITLVYRFQMLKQTRQSDFALFARLAKLDEGVTAETAPLRVLVPAFVTSELKSAFQIGFMIFIPFLIIDMVVSSVLMSLGMMMLSPVLVALPFKLMLFVLADGWNLLIGSLAASFAT